jgi:hypothetical protein
VLRVAALASFVAAAAACSRPAASSSAPAIRLVEPSGATAYVDVIGLDGRVVDRLEDADLTAEQWGSFFRVSVSDEAPAILGTYSVVSGALRFTPAFAFDPGRTYKVHFDGARIPIGAPSPVTLTADVARAATAAGPSTVVAQVYPSGGIVPENLLRMYIEFSAPMGRRTGIEYLRLEDDRGKVVENPFLPLDYEFWSPDRRRFTVFFDPGRVKDGILPNREMGRALYAGRTYTLIISREWRDDQGLPLKEDYRHTMRVGPAQADALDATDWRIVSPPPGSREPVTVTFPYALDHGLLTRALGVRHDGAQVEGDIRVESGETRWVFTPRAPWRPGRYDLLALSILEDAAGNQIGRAFEVDNFDTVDKSPNPQTVLLPFRIGSPTTE